MVHEGQILLGLTTFANMIGRLGIAERCRHPQKHRKPMDVFLADLGSDFDRMWIPGDRPKVFA